MSSSDHIITGKMQRMKWYYTYDVSDRVSAIYEAHADTAHGKPCLKTTYEYSGSSTRITKAKEEDATWDSSYDI